MAISSIFRRWEWLFFGYRLQWKSAILTTNDTPAQRRTPLLPGDTVVILGLGSIGLLMLQAFKALGTGQSIPCGRSIRVYGVDLLPERLALARKLGADDAFLVPTDEQGLRQLLAPHTEGRGADVVMLPLCDNTQL